jgi:hypothetical protein
MAASGLMQRVGKYDWVWLVCIAQGREDGCLKKAVLRAWHGMHALHGILRP